MECPTCRKAFTLTDVVDLPTGSLSYRIWSETEMKCGDHDRGCPWVGSIVEAKAHMQSCTYVDRIKKLEDELDALKKECLDLKRDVDNRKIMNDNLDKQLRAANTGLADKTAKARVLKDEINILKQRVKAMETSWRGNGFAQGGFGTAPSSLPGTISYNFDRFSIVRLSQLIARDIDNKPHHIDPDQIFANVCNCNEAHLKCNDNPTNYRLHVQMLLSTCLSSNWFSRQQCEYFLSWMTFYGWKVQ